MDITSAIVLMIVKAARPTAERAFKDGYAALRIVLLRKYGTSLGLTLEDLEENPDSIDLQNRFSFLLQQSGADRDPDVTSLTARLLGAVLDDMHEVAPEGRLERARRQAGGRAIQLVLGRHVDGVLDARRQHRVNDVDLVSSRIGASGLPPEVSAGLSSLHTNIKFLIEQTASLLVEDLYREARREVTEDRDVGLEFLHQADELIAADRRVQLSYQTLQLTVEYFRDLNQGILRRIEEEAEAGRQGRMMLGNAIMVHEVADFAIGFIEGFSPAGLEDVDRLHAMFKTRMLDQAAHDARQADAIAAAVRTSPELRDDLRRNLEDRAQARRIAEEEWIKYVADVRTLAGAADEIRDSLETLLLIRGDAAGQISILQEISLLRYLKQNTSSISKTVDAVSALRMAPLSSNRVRRLLEQQ